MGGLMNVYTAFCSAILFPLHEALKKHSTVKTRHQMALFRRRTFDFFKLAKIEKVMVF